MARKIIKEFPTCKVLYILINGYGRESIEKFPSPNEKRYN